MQTSEAIDKIAPAFVKAQAACNGAKKASNNPHFKSKYADLTQVWAACEDALEANGLAVIQGLGTVEDGKMHMDTMILHSSGQWLESHSSIPLPKNDPQGYGSATTYLRRYALAAMLGVVQEDDDGNAASIGQRNEPAKVITDAQYAELATLVDQTKTDLAKFCKFYRCDALIHLPADRFDHAKAALLKKLPAPKQEAA